MLEEIKIDLPVTPQTRPERTETLYAETIPPPLGTPSLDEAKRFLSALARSGLITFQSLPERKLADPDSRPRINLNRTVHGRFDSLSRLLRSLNEEGACIFLMVNGGDGKGRKSENVRTVRALFVDLDGSDLQPVLDAEVPPSITVESSPSRYHAYWLVSDMPLNEFKAAQQKLAEIFDGDKAVCDLPRLMRVPGFLHQKHATAFQSRLLTCHPERIYPWKYLAAELGLPIAPYLPDEILKGERNSVLFKLAARAAITGTDRHQELIELTRINELRCKPPLPAKEIAEIVDRAYKNPPSGTMKIPLSLLNDERFLRLGRGRKLLLLLAYQKVANRSDGAEIPILWKDFKQHFPRENTFKDFRKDTVRAGLLIPTKQAKYRPGSAPDFNRYRLAVSA